MSGSPSLAEVHTQFTNAITIPERLRAFVDGSTFLALSGGAFDTLTQSLEGSYTPALIGAMAGTRAAVSEALSPAAAQSYILPILYEYGRLIGFGGAYTDPSSLMRAVYDYFHDNTITVEDRAITYDTTFTAGGSNVGNGACSRLTVDENNYPLQFCTIEKKILRCRQDQTTNQNTKNAEVFEILGAQPSQDNTLLASFGSGVQAIIRSHHAGTGEGGSLLNNSSFDTYSASATNRFTSWVASGAGAAGIDQDTTNYYRTNPSATTNGSLKIPGTGGTVTLSQSLSAMRVRSLNPETPYFYRVMLNKTVGTASGGTVTIRMGGQDASVTILALGSGWQELLITPGTDCWLRNFNEADLTVEIEWAPGGGGSGYLLVDDAIMAPWDLVDGTYWFLRGNATTHTPWMIDDTLEVTDTGGAPATAKIQWWLWRAGLGYLPSTTGTPTISEPS